MASANIQLVRRFFDEVCNARRLDAADQLFSADHDYRDPGSPWVGKGPAGMKDVIGVYHDRYVRTPAGWRFAARREQTLSFTGGRFAEIAAARVRTSEP